ncbi:hypothetical protein [Solimonas terrae]|uniref:Uncharacterized protein n=1 Tax=Solimonas terrae TaxID=1396819 RepID=A0A6M2BMI0_9GAMM|nr:hypothetical protein [Solimonas terrae]NGY03451.1 hypothetical protein [Solimonas terrae]
MSKARANDAAHLAELKKRAAAGEELSDDDVRALIAESSRVNKLVEDFEHDLASVELECSYTKNPITGVEGFPLQYSYSADKLITPEDRAELGPRNRGRPKLVSYALLALEVARGQLSGGKAVRTSYKGGAKNTPQNAFQKFKEIVVPAAKENAFAEVEEKTLKAMRSLASLNNCVTSDVALIASNAGITADACEAAITSLSSEGRITEVQGGWLLAVE